MGDGGSSPPEGLRECGAHSFSRDRKLFLATPIIDARLTYLRLYAFVTADNENRLEMLCRVVLFDHGINETPTAHSFQGQYIPPYARHFGPMAGTSAGKLAVGILDVTWHTVQDSSYEVKQILLKPLKTHTPLARDILKPSSGGAGTQAGVIGILTDNEPAEPFSVFSACFASSATTFIRWFGGGIGLAQWWWDRRKTDGNHVTVFVDLPPRLGRPKWQVPPLKPCTAD
ncbi:hypothetical protein C8J57DRAFT_1257769 [Mycena rebaudengoi]|nr:hypothetical protein C8J57DRAFT_1257769 [Mycena rebaudengoi]